jgi:hypothetical protein
LGTDFGISVTTASDVNGDGYSDVIIGSRFFRNGGMNEGGVEYDGAADGLEDQPAWVFKTNQANILLGCEEESDGRSGPGQRWRRVLVRVPPPATGKTGWMPVHGRPPALIGRSRPHRRAARAGTSWVAGR